MNKNSGKYLDHALPQETEASVVVDANSSAKPRATGERLGSARSAMATDATRTEGVNPMADPRPIVNFVQRILSIEPRWNVFPENIDVLTVYVDEYLAPLDHFEPSCIIWRINIGRMALEFRTMNNETKNIAADCEELARVFWISVGRDEYPHECEDMSADLCSLMKCGYSPAHLLMCLMAPCPEALRTKEWKPEYDYLMARVAVQLGPLVDATSET